MTVGETVGDGGANRESRCCPTVSDGATKESPREFGSKGGSFKEVCVAGNAPEAPKPHTQVPNFEPLDLRMAARLRPAWGEKAIDTCKGKIYALEQSRNPIPNRQEVIAAYKQRIKDVKKWMVGER